MSVSRSCVLSINEYFHVYNRGVDKRKIFLSRSDYERFLSLLLACNNSYPVDLKLQGSSLSELVEIEKKKKITSIGAYCLMPNHFHIILKETAENGISRFMQKLQTAYTMYFNKKNERSGSLFQGTFKAVHANHDTYLKYLVSYIHLNPVKLIQPNWKEIGIGDLQKAEIFLNGYKYSSYQDFLGINRIENHILDRECLPKYFENLKHFIGTTKEWLQLRSDFYKV